MKLNSFALGAFIVILLFGGIGVSAAMNLWQTESSKIAATYSTGKFSGQANPADIRGSYTFGDVNKNFGVSLQDLSVAFRLPASTDPALFQVKDLESIYADLPFEVGTASVRMFVAFYKGLPYDLTTAEDTYLFPEAAQILIAQNKMLPEQSEFLASHLVSEAADASAPAVITPQVTSQVTTTAGATGYVPEEFTVTGSTTFQDLLDWGVSQEVIENAISDEMPDPTVVIKDYATGKGLEFYSIKSSLQAEVDKLK